MATDPIPAHLHSYLDSLVPPRSPELQAMEAHANKVGFNRETSENVRNGNDMEWLSIDGKSVIVLQ